MVDCHYSPHLLGTMDRLWFQQVIFSPVEPIQHPTTTHKNSNLKPLQVIPMSSPSNDGIMCTNSSPNLESTLLDHEPLSTISDSSPNLITPKESDELGKEKDDEMKMENYKMKRPKRLSLVGSKSRCRSSSPSLYTKIPAHITRNRVIDLHGNITTSSSKLRKTMSCKSLWELEYEEVKGFMDLGFRFDKEQICPRMMSVIPGLQRLDSLEFQELISSSTSTSTSSLEEEEIVERPYLSEAWLIKKPNSPLLNLRMPPVTASNDMKNHLRFWARTVACAVKLEV
ncbi:hypothetical protein MKW94_028676 [Papaver nudicaule]|uniref:Uncharacterized protein n=1 Tax=Papaver nudicaule TaxID=74823 RepID=A0AA42B350_PAPNU|nr:hypothetical protein [Papaver nudicaule]